MRLLYLAYRHPYPPDKGERIRMYHQIRALAETFEVEVVCPREEESGETPVRLGGTRVHTAGVAAPLLRARELAHLVSGRPRLLGTHQSHPLVRLTRGLLERGGFDVVFASTLFAAESVRGEGGLPKVIDFMDMYSEVVRIQAELPHRKLRWLDRLENRLLQKYELALAKDFDHAIFVSQAEASQFRELGVPAPVSAIGNGVDLDYFALRDSAPDSEPRNIVFVGTMDYSLNIDAVCYFASQIFAPLAADDPELRFQIVGRNPSPEVKRLADHPAVQVVGEVPDVRPFLAAATLSVAPFRFARGVQNKILEAMALGVPVLASRSAAEGLDCDDDVLATCSADADDFRRQTSHLLGNEEARHARSMAGRRYVEHAHRWSDRGAELRDVVTSTIEVKRSRAH